MQDDKDPPPISEAGDNLTGPGQEHRIPVGSRLGDYEILEEIGSGGMGIVYKASEQSLRRIVALKVLHPEISSNPSYLKRFHREAVLAANLSHPNIVPVFHVDQHANPPYFVMEFVQGCSLKEKIEREGFLQPEEAIRIVLQACDALQHAHDNGILHRDVKPENILLQNHLERVRITDFGIAQDQTGRLAEVTRTEGVAPGTLAFMSPEQNLGEPLDARTDVFSLGMTLYYSLTGKVAYRARNRAELALAFRAQSPTPPSLLNPQVSKAMDRIVMKMIAVDPSSRYSTCQAIAVDLREMAPGISGNYRPGRTRRVRRWHLVIGATSVVVAGLCSFFLVKVRPSPTPTASAPQAARAKAAPKAATRKTVILQPKTPVPTSQTGPEASAQVLLAQLQAAIDLKNWNAALSYLDTLKADYGDTHAVKDSAKELTAWEEQIQPHVAELRSAQEAAAAVALQNLELFLHRKDFLRAYLNLKKLAEPLRFTDLSRQASQKINAYTQAISAGFDTSRIEDHGEYLIVPPAGDRWQEAIQKAQGIMETVDPMRPRMPSDDFRSVAVLRVITEDEESESAPGLRLANGCEFARPDAHSTLGGIQSGGFVFIVPDAIFSHRISGPFGKAEPPQAMFSCYQHFHPTVQFEFQHKKVISIGDIVLRAAPENQKGRAVVKVRLEDGADLGEQKLCIAGRYQSQSTPLSGGGTQWSSPPILAGDYQIGLGSGRDAVCAALPVAIRIEAQKTTEVEFFVARQRQIMFTWWFRESGTKAWQSDTDTLPLCYTWQPKQWWGSYITANLLRFEPGKEGGCSISPINITLVRVDEKKTPDEQGFAFPKIDASRRDLTVTRGDVFAIKAMGFGRRPGVDEPSPEIVIQIRDIKLADQPGHATTRPTAP